MAGIVKIGEDGVNSRIKNNLAILDRMPKPLSGFHYHDIVEVQGPTGQNWMIRDEEIPEFEIVRLYKPSGCKTYLFTAVIPTIKDYFALQDVFRGDQLYVEIPCPYFTSKNPFCYEWQQCYCTASSIYLVKELLKKFIEGNKTRKVKNIVAEAAFL